MPCETIREILLDLDLDEAGRERVAAALKHLSECPDCRKAMSDFDALRNAITVPDTDDEPVGGWAAFEQQLNERTAPRRPAWPWIRTFAIAASGLAVAAAFEFGRLAASQSRHDAALARVETSGLDANDSRFTPGDIKPEISAFHQVCQVFDGRAGWMVTSKQDSDVGIADSDVDAVGKVLLLRLTVADTDKEVSSADLLVIPGQTARLKIPLSSGSVLHYRITTSADEPTHLTIMLELLTPNGTEPLAALSTDLRMQPGQRVTAGELCSSSNRYTLKIGFERASLAQ
jgi:hypothetical protein